MHINNIKITGFLIGDKPFPLKTHPLRPYSRKQLNCDEKRGKNHRRYRARWTGDNAFGLLTQEFGIYYIL